MRTQVGRAGAAERHMTESKVTFDDGAAYERFMGRWSRAVGAAFIDWIAPPRNARWLDVGCGTGVFTQLVLDNCSPAAMTAVDPAAAQIEHARRQSFATRADFRIANAEALPFPDRSFDVVVSALVVNFIPDRPRALREMRRVGDQDALVAAYVWDFAAGRGAAWPLLHGLRELDVEAPQPPGTDDTRIEALTSLFEGAGLKEVDARPIDVTVIFPGFDDFWHSQIPPCTPHGKIVAALPDAARAKLAAMVRAELPMGSDGSIAYSARANAIKGRVPR